MNKFSMGYKIRKHSGSVFSEEMEMLHKKPLCFGDDFIKDSGWFATAKYK